MSIPTPVILDISEWQTPSSINYDKLAKAVDGVIIRIQYGSNYVDKHYKTHISEFKKRGVPIAVYAWVRGSSHSDMETEAKDFYNRAKAYDPSFWWLDVEEKSMSDMRGGVEKYRAKLKSLGAKKVGAYIANHLYSSFNLNTSKFDGIWIPTYGSNNGQYNGSNPTATSNYDIHQYTSNGKLSGYSGPLDLNRIVKKGFNYFFGTATTDSNTGSTNTGSTSKPSYTKLTVDGKFGAATAKRLQQYFGTTQDGVISHQYKQKYNQNVYAAQFDKTLIGSNVVVALQKWLKVEADGLCGKATIVALQKRMGTTADGFISPVSDCVKELQRALNNNKLPW
ncbi:glycoside hydrolase family 25 protein [Enterococcus songbeiensis]|uniref:glycoside hydrolase family 25 protein n=1 Tax=Enterococcus songbeiensis TaxID=2559927 RepID=UPI0010F5589C|nr:glycoside hydrolase family 25 protein [Enterococcus songbeiensis]